MYKLAHLSDLHIGYSSTRKVNDQGLNVRFVDGLLAFSQSVTEIIEECCDAVVVAGDIFHSPTPDIRSIVFAQNQFRRLSDAGIPVYSLAGNHDILDVKSSLGATKVLDDPARKIYSTAEPYVTHEITDGMFLHLCSHHLYSLQSDTMNKVKPVEGALNIFSTHGSVIDPLLKMKLHTEQSPREVVIPEHMFRDKNWSYALLGHIHERGWVGSKDSKTDTSKTKTYYNGSIIRRGFSDKDVPLGRGWTLWNIDTDGKFTPEHRTVGQRPQQDFPIIDAKELTPIDITSLIVDNLKLTQLGDKSFDISQAPLLRQRIINLTPAKYSSLNWNIIHNNNQHALQWSLHQLHKNEEAEAKKGITATSGSGDIVELYNSWVSGAASLKSVSESIKEDIETQAREFIKLGQQVVLDE